MSEIFPIYLQYQNSPKLQSLVQKSANALLFKDFDFSEQYLNIQTANTDGLNSWGIILNQSRTVRSGLAYDGVFGFDDGEIITDTTSYPQNFYDSNFFNEEYSPSIDLTNDQYRALLLLIYRSKIINNSLKQINDVIRKYSNMMGKTEIPVVYSTYDMNIVYKFNYVLIPYEAYLFTHNNILPNPCGVGLTIEY